MDLSSSGSIPNADSARKVSGSMTAVALAHWPAAGDESPIGTGGVRARRAPVVALVARTSIADQRLDVCRGRQRAG